MFENYLYATNSENANMQPKTNVIKINRFNNSDYQVVTRVDKGGALHVYHQRRQPPGTERTFALQRTVCWLHLILNAVFLGVQCAVTRVRWTSLERPAAAPTSASWETVTRPEPAAVALDSAWAATASPAKVSHGMNHAANLRSLHIDKVIMKMTDTGVV